MKQQGMKYSAIVISSAVSSVYPLTHFSSAIYMPNCKVFYEKPLMAITESCSDFH